MSYIPLGPAAFCMLSTPTPHSCHYQESTGGMGGTIAGDSTVAQASVVRGPGESVGVLAMEDPSGVGLSQGVLVYLEPQWIAWHLRGIS